VKELTSSRRENGRHDLNAAFASISFINDEQVVVIFELNPLSKGVGTELMLADVAVAMPAAADVVVVGEDEDCAIDSTEAEEEVESSPTRSSRRRRSFAETP